MAKKIIQPVTVFEPIIEQMPDGKINGMPHSPERFLSAVKRYLVEKNSETPNPKEFLDFYSSISSRQLPVTREQFVQKIEEYKTMADARLKETGEYPTIAEFIGSLSDGTINKQAVVTNYPEEYQKFINYIEHKYINRGGKDTGITIFALKNVKEMNFGEGYKDKTEHNLNVVPVQFIGEENLLE